MAEQLSTDAFIVSVRNECHDASLGAASPDVLQCHARLRRDLYAPYGTVMRNVLWVTRH